MSHPRRIATVGVTALVVAGGAVVAATGAFGIGNAHSASVRASGTARVGPGPVIARLATHGYRLELRVSPNRAVGPRSTATLRLARQGRPVNGAGIRLTFTMLDMNMGEITSPLPQTAPGRYGHAAPLLMFGRWGIRVVVQPPSDAAFSVNLVDRVGA